MDKDKTFYKRLTALLISVNILTLCVVFFLLFIIFPGNKVADVAGVEPSSSPLVTVSPTEVLAGKTYFVDPKGNDSNNGSQAKSAFKTIQKGIDTALAGDTVVIAPGLYKEDVITKRSGTKEKPIVVKGSVNAIVNGNGKSHVFEINHSYITLDGFTIDGLAGSSSNVTSFRDKLLYVFGREPKDGPTGLKITNMILKNAAGECLRLRYFVHESEISGNTIGPCGIADFKFTSDSKNGEGIYVGTSSNQWGDGKNPTSDPDNSTKNWIHHNKFDTEGNECVDIKEGATFNIVEYNDCTGQSDPESGGFDSRGDNNTFRYNTSHDNKGAGVRLGGHAVDGITYGKNNEVYANTIKNNAAGGIKVEVVPQGKVCGNTMSANATGNAVGSKKSSIKPTGTCI